MGTYSEDEVYTVLAPYHDKILNAVIDGYSEWSQVSTYRSTCGFARPRYRRTEANYLFEAITENARNIFLGDDSVRIVEETQTVKFCFDNKVIARFKKSGCNKLGSNISTQAVLNFTDPQASIAGLPPEAAKVEFIWKINEIEDSVESVEVVARDGNRVLWAYALDKTENDDVYHLPLIIQQSYDEKKDALVRPKIGAVKRENKS